jgi:hypothetical protein
MSREEILKQIKEAVTIKPYSNGQTSMGVDENYYNSSYLIGECFTEEELNSMDEVCLNNLIKLAKFAGEVFY